MTGYSTYEHPQDRQRRTNWEWIGPERAICEAHDAYCTRPGEWFSTTATGGALLCPIHMQERLGQFPHAVRG